MSLTDVAIRKAKAGEKTIKLYDERGLYLEVSPSGGKWWRLKYRFEGKEKRLSLGVYPDVGLKEARDRRDAARKVLADGVDPSANRKAQKAAKADRAANSFEVLAREWYAKFVSAWGDLHRERVLRRLERDVFPWIGERPIAAILFSLPSGSTTQMPTRPSRRSPVSSNWASVRISQCSSSDTKRRRSRPRRPRSSMT